MGQQAILCVDDEAIILMHLSMILQARYQPQFLLKTASSAALALKTISALHRDGIRLLVVISDWLMPGVKGDELLRQIKVLHPEVRTIMISGKTDEASLGQLRQDTGLVGFLPKPVQNERLFELIDSLIEEDRVPV
jgi:DNA-binding NtrC family response regulator